MAVFEKVQEIIVEELGKDTDEVKLETTFDELDADSLDVFQVISEIEDEFDIQIESEDGLNTVGDLVAFVEERIFFLLYYNSLTVKLLIEKLRKFNLK